MQSLISFLIRIAATGNPNSAGFWVSKLVQHADADQ